MALLIAGLFLFFLLLTGCIGLALWSGGRDERIGAVVLLAGVLLSQIASLNGKYAGSPEYGVMVVDAATFAAFFLIARRSERFWPLWAAAAQLVATLTHLAPMFTQISKETYATMQPIWVFPVMVSLVVGTLNHQLRREPSRSPPSSNSHNT